MKFIILLIIFFLIGAGMALYGYRWMGAAGSVPLIQRGASAPLPTSSFSLDQAPKNSLRGTILSQSGKIDWQSRTATVPIPLPANIPLQQGETLIASSGATLTASFANTDTIRLGSDTTIDIIQTLPGGLVFVQKRGTVSYTAQPQLPLSVRSFELLSTLSEGTITISIDADEGTIKVTTGKGRATVAFNDADFVSQVVSVEEGSSFLFTQETRSGTLL